MLGHSILVRVLWRWPLDQDHNQAVRQTTCGDLDQQRHRHRIQGGLIKLPLTDNHLGSNHASHHMESNFQQYVSNFIKTFVLVSAGFYLPIKCSIMEHWSFVIQEPALTLLLACLPPPSSYSCKFSAPSFSPGLSSLTCHQLGQYKLSTSRSSPILQSLTCYCSRQIVKLHVPVHCGYATIWPICIGQLMPVNALVIWRIIWLIDIILTSK